MSSYNEDSRNNSRKNLFRLGFKKRSRTAKSDEE
jgi:hypothetical protein